jgi:hypothetical protein
LAGNCHEDAGQVALRRYEDGEHFLLVPRASVADYQKGRDFVTIREIIAPSEERDKRLREMSLSEFAALHKDTVVLLPPDKASFPVPGKLNIRIDSYNLPIERPLK